MCFISFLLLGLGLYFAIASATPYPVLPSITSLSKASRQPTADLIQKVAFKVPCVACLPSGDDAVLDFELQHPPVSSSTNLCTIPFALNGQPVTLDNDHSSSKSLQVSASQWELNLTVQALCVTGTDFAIAQRALFFNISQFDNSLLKLPRSFTAVLSNTEKTQVLVGSTDERKDCASALSSVVDETSFLFNRLADVSEYNDTDSSTDIDFTEQFLRRRLYEQAAKLHELNEECRNTSRRKFSECNRDLSCMAKLMCERIHDTTSTHIAKIQKSLKQSVMVSKQRYEQYIAADDNDVWDFNTTAFDSLLSESGEKSKNAIESQHPLVVALEILAAAIGLAALYRFIWRRCCSLRRRVERLADREERDRARHFRCLARREALRKKWVSFKSVFSRGSRSGDYEEKRALVIEAAGGVVGDYITESYNTNDPEMGDAVGDLRRAHQFVAAYVRHSFDNRTRSGSLPSYTEEKLPDYTSTDENDYHVANGFKYAPSIAGSGSGITPDSSIVLSRRCSRETLRTGTDISNDL